MKLLTLCANYLEAHYFDLEDSTRETTERAFKYLVGVVGNIEAKNLKAPHIQKYKGWLITEQGLKKSSGSVMYRAISPVLRWAANEEEILKNPLDTVKDFRYTERPPRPYENGQVQAMLDGASDVWRARILLARHCGLRRSEVLNLTIKNIRNGYVYIEPKENTADTWEWQPKTKEVRCVPLPSDEITEAVFKLPGFYSLLPAATYRRMLSKQKKGWLKRRERICPLWNFDRDFRKLQKRVFGQALENNFHDLRVTYCTAGLEAGVPLHIMQRLMGHSSIKTTMTYYTVARQSAIEQAAETLSNAYKKGDTALSQSNIVGGKPLLGLHRQSG